MKKLFLNLQGTISKTFRLGISGPFLAASDDSRTVSVTDNLGNYAQVAAALFNTFGDDLVLNAGATQTGTDWSFTLSRPQNQTFNYKLILPGTRPDEGSLLRVVDINNNIISLGWVTPNATLFTTGEVNQTVIVLQDQLIALPHQTVLWSSLSVNGLRQKTASYSVEDGILTVPQNLIWIGAEISFEFIF